MCDADLGLPIMGSNHPIAGGDAYGNQASQWFCIKLLQCLDKIRHYWLHITTTKTIMVLVQRN